MTAPLVHLRKYRPDDGQLLSSWIASPTELVTWSGRAFVWPLDERRLAAYAAESEGPGRRSWTGIDSRTGQEVGHVSLRLDVERVEARLGRVLVAPEARGRGVGAGMLGEVLSLAFGALGFRSVELGVFSHNTSALRLYERMGFQVAEVLPDVERVDGHPWSATQMRLTKADWLRGGVDGA